MSVIIHIQGKEENLPVKQWLNDKEWATLIFSLLSDTDAGGFIFGTWRARSEEQCEKIIGETLLSLTKFGSPQQVKEKLKRGGEAYSSIAIEEGIHKFLVEHPHIYEVVEYALDTQRNPSRESDLIALIAYQEESQERKTAGETSKREGPFLWGIDYGNEDERLLGQSRGEQQRRAVDYSFWQRMFDVQGRGFPIVVRTEENGYEGGMVVCARTRDY